MNKQVELHGSLKRSEVDGMNRLRVEALRERDEALQAHSRMKELYEITLANEQEWMRKWEQAKELTEQYQRESFASASEASARLGELVTVRKELEKVERNAERYLWLRQKSSHGAMTGKKYAGQIQIVLWTGRSEAEVLTYAALDAAIDAEIDTEGKR